MLALSLGLSIGTATGTGGAIGIILPPYVAPQSLDNVGTFNSGTTHVFDTLSIAQFGEAYGSSPKLAVNYIDANNYIYLQANAGDGGWILVYRNAGSESNLISYQSIPGGITSDMKRRVEIVPLDATHSDIVVTVGPSTNTYHGVNLPGPSTKVAIIGGSNATNVLLGAPVNPLLILGTSFNASTRKMSFHISYSSATAPTYEYQTNGGTWVDCTAVANAASGDAVIQASDALSTGLNGTQPTFVVRQKGTGTTASTTYYIPTPPAYGMNLTSQTLGENSRAVRNLVLYGAWQSTESGSPVYTHDANPAYISASFMPVANAPTGFQWLKLLMFPHTSGQRVRVRCNATDATFNLDAGIAQNQTLGSGGGYKWIDADFVFDPSVSDDGAYANLYITSIGSATLWEAYEIDGSGNALETGYWDMSFIAQNQKFDTIRFMDWMDTNGNNAAMTWADRPLGTVWQSVYGMPYDHMMDLWTAIGASGWFNVPYKASDDWIDGFSDLLMATVPAGKKCYIEVMGNEPWNSYFTVWAQLRDDGIAQGVTYPGGGTPSSNHDYALCMGAKRGAYVADRIAARWVSGGKRSQLVLVMGVEAGSGNYDIVIPNYSLNTKIDAVAIQHYFGSNANNDPTPTTSADDIFARYRTGTAVSLDAIESRMTTSKNKINTYGLRMLVYEGGQEKFNGDGSYALARTVNHDSRMKSFMLDYYAGHSGIAGDLLCVYQDFKRITDAGAYGQQEYPGQARALAPKYDALLETMGL